MDMLPLVMIRKFWGLITTHTDHNALPSLLSVVVRGLHGSELPLHSLAGYQPTFPRPDYPGRDTPC